MRRSALPVAVAVLAALLTLQLAQAQRHDAFVGYSEKAQDFAFIITTKFGKIRILPRADISPGIVRLVMELAKAKECAPCRFYRHEPVPKNWGVAGFYGDPYALLQGSLSAMTEMPPFEGHPVVAKGDVCIIPNSKEFFIATASHEEWGTAHSVWGKVVDDESWATIAAIPYEPFTTITDKNNITTRWLTQEANVPFNLTVEHGSSSTAGHVNVDVV